MRKSGDVWFVMSKHPRYQHTLEDVALRVFVYVDNWLNANEARFSLPKQASQVASYSELVTIALVGELKRAALCNGVVLAGTATSP